MKYICTRLDLEDPEVHEEGYNGYFGLIYDDGSCYIGGWTDEELPYRCKNEDHMKWELLNGYEEYGYGYFDHLHDDVKYDLQQILDKILANHSENDPWWDNNGVQLEVDFENSASSCLYGKHNGKWSKYDPDGAYVGKFESFDDMIKDMWNILKAGWEEVYEFDGPLSSYFNEDTYIEESYYKSKLR